MPPRKQPPRQDPEEEDDTLVTSKQFKEMMHMMESLTASMNEMFDKTTTSMNKMSHKSQASTETTLEWMHRVICFATYQRASYHTQYFHLGKKKGEITLKDVRDTVIAEQ
jgi:hypothetical protein